MASKAADRSPDPGGGGGGRTSGRGGGARNGALLLDIQRRYAKMKRLEQARVRAVRDLKLRQIEFEKRLVVAENLRVHVFEELALNVEDRRNTVEFGQRSPLNFQQTLAYRKLCRYLRYHPRALASALSQTLYPRSTSASSSTRTSKNHQASSSKSPNADQTSNSAPSQSDPPPATVSTTSSSSSSQAKPRRFLAQSHHGPPESSESSCSSREAHWPRSRVPFKCPSTADIHAKEVDRLARFIVFEIYGSPEDELHLLRLLEELIKLASIARRSTLADRLRRKPAPSPSSRSAPPQNDGADTKSVKSPRLSAVSLKLPKALSDKLGSGSSNQKSKSPPDRRERTPMSQRKFPSFLDIESIATALIKCYLKRSGSEYLNLTIKNTVVSLIEDQSLNFGGPTQTPRLQQVGKHLLQSASSKLQSLSAAGHPHPLESPTNANGSSATLSTPRASSGGGAKGFLQRLGSATGSSSSSNDKASSSRSSDRTRGDELKARHRRTNSDEIEDLIRLSTDLLQDIVDSARSVPFGIRYLARVVQRASAAHLDGEEAPTEQEKLSMVSDLIFIRWIVDCVLFPQSHGFISHRPLGQHYRSNLERIATLLMKVVNMSRFGEEHLHYRELNRVLDTFEPKMWSFVRKVTQQTESLEDRFGLATDSAAGEEATDMKTSQPANRSSSSELPPASTSSTDSRDQRVPNSLVVRPNSLFLLHAIVSAEGSHHSPELCEILEELAASFNATATSVESADDAKHSVAIIENDDKASPFPPRLVDSSANVFFALDLGSTSKLLEDETAELHSVDFTSSLDLIRRSASGPTADKGSSAAVGADLSAGSLPVELIKDSDFRPSFLALFDLMSASFEAVAALDQRASFGSTFRRKDATVWHVLQEQSQRAYAAHDMPSYTIICEIVDQLRSSYDSTSPFARNDFSAFLALARTLIDRKLSLLEASRVPFRLIEAQASLEIDLATSQSRKSTMLELVQRFQIRQVLHNALSKLSIYESFLDKHDAANPANQSNPEYQCGGGIALQHDRFICRHCARRISLHRNGLVKYLNQNAIGPGAKTLATAAPPLDFKYDHSRAGAIVTDYVIETLAKKFWLRCTQEDSRFASHLRFLNACFKDFSAFEAYFEQSLGQQGQGDDAAPSLELSGTASPSPSLSPLATPTGAAARDRKRMSFSSRPMPTHVSGASASASASASTPRTPRNGGGGDTPTGTSSAGTPTLGDTGSGTGSSRDSNSQSDERENSRSKSAEAADTDLPDTKDTTREVHKNDSKRGATIQLRTLDSAIQSLSSIYSHQTILGKLKCLEDARSIITAALTLYPNAGADDYMPLFCYVMMRANPSNFLSGLQFIKVIDQQHRSTTQSKAFVDCCVAVKLLIKMRPGQSFLFEGHARTLETMGFSRAHIELAGDMVGKGDLDKMLDFLSIYRSLREIGYREDLCVRAIRACSKTLTLQACVDYITRRGLDK